ncbi:hypothetical protein Btru_043414 [Bulinus truncatus]|nr:hypothetical protein Btru_043414 [Bulinus truncatus]
MQPVVQRHTALSASTKANHNLLKTTPAQIPTPVAAIPEKGTEPNLTPGSISGINVGSSVNNLPLTSTASHQNFSPGVISAPHRNTGSNQVSVNGSSTASSTNNKEQGPTYSELGIVTERPKRSEYAVKEQRIKTFSSWPRSHHLDVGDLADAGFYYAGYSDCARCFFCGGGLRNWEEEDNVFVEHARWFPKCAFIRELLGQNFVDAVQELNKTKDKCYVIHLRTEHNHPTHIGGVAWNDFKYEMLRLGTFCNYPSNASKSAIILAGDGFVYIGSGRDDAVMCYACCWIKCNWLEDEDVSQVHSMMSRHCSMTKRTDSDNVPIPPVNVRFEDILGYLQMLKRYILTVTNDQSTELEIITERPKYEGLFGND